MKQICLLATATIAACFFFACNKEKVMMPVATPIDSVATYKIIITGTWQTPQHTIPAGNHFTPFVGMVHSSSTGIFKLGSLASKGVEDVAEVGNNAALQNEIAGYIASGKASKSFVVSLPGITGTDSAIIYLNTKNPLVSFESMIAPSPDWFVGIDSYSLIQKDTWVKDVTITAPGYDAGTEDGNVFGYDNPATMPQQPISYLSPANASVIANGNAVVAPFIRVRFVKQ